MIRLTAMLLWIALLTVPARAHEGHAHEACPPGEVCGQAAIVGSWGLIVLGLMFWLIALLPYRGPSEVGEGRGRSLLRLLRTRIDKETTGWRRLQWPVLGLTFIALGVATLVGWR